MTQDSTTSDILWGTCEFIKQGVRFKPPTIICIWWDFLDLKIGSPSSLVAKSLLWDMEDIYGATKANIHG
jgi:hypothetical protein